MANAITTDFILGKDFLKTMYFFLFIAVINFHAGIGASRGLTKLC